MWFWIIDLPALIVTWLFRLYFMVLAALALVCFVMASYSVLALWMEWPRYW